MALLRSTIVPYYGAIHALHGVSIAVEPGEIVTLIGANGAGKTTTLNSIGGIVRPRSRPRLRRPGRPDAVARPHLVRPGRRPGARGTRASSRA